LLLGGVIACSMTHGLRTGRRCQKLLHTGDIKVAKLRLRDLELATTDSGPHASEPLGAALRSDSGARRAC